jgi:hypothetical protein
MVKNIRGTKFRMLDHGSSERHFRNKLGYMDKKYQILQCQKDYKYTKSCYTITLTLEFNTLMKGEIPRINYTNTAKTIYKKKLSCRQIIQYSEMKKINMLRYFDTREP